MKRSQRVVSKVRPVAAACAMLALTQFAINTAHANAGFGSNTNIAGNPIAVPTYYANSPQGWQPALDVNNQQLINPSTGNPYTAAEALAANGGMNAAGTEPLNKVVPMVNTGHALRKFVDTLPGAYNGLDGMPSIGVPMGIPVAIPDQWVDANLNPVNGNSDDFYELAIVEYTQQLHSDLAKPTRLRGYVQIETPNMVAKGLKDATGVIGSEHIKAYYADGVTPIVDMQGNQVYFAHAPHYLGPTIVATRGKAVRMLFHNYLPYTDVNGNSVGSVNGMGGELPIPVDEYIPGGGPLVNADGTPHLINGKPVKFGQNRAAIHLHGGDTPWIGDGTPHQWFAPGRDIAWSLTDASHKNGLGKGDSFQNVPDMADPGPGSQTLYFPNNQSGRLQFYHDHTSGLTKLNVYMGEAAGYVIVDPVELGLAASTLNTSLSATTTPVTGPLTGKTINTGLLDAVGIPLVLQDRQFVPKNMGPLAKSTIGQIQSQDSKWDQAHWGLEGDLFFPHVYEVNQDPNSIDGTNPVGRWDWGPWFWPVFPAQYSLPSGNYGDVTATPEAFVDTAMVNGVVYPTMTVDPKTYRFRILSVGNDRSLNLGLYMAVDANGAICDAATAPAVAQPAPGETAPLAACTEMRMVPASQSSNLPAGWPTDGRAGGVPDPLTIGPDIVQIGNETGLLPAPAVWHAQPVTFDQNVRSMTVYNVLNHQLLLAAAERADVFIDFSKYAGKTLILYNDAPAPMPGFDPRIDYYTGAGDQTTGGGAYDTLPGYGPNTRTYMQIKVKPGTPAAPLDVAALAQALPVAYAQTRPKPLVPETTYNTVFPGSATQDNYARIFTGSATQPAFSYPLPGVEIGNVNATTGLLDLSNAVAIGNTGSGYLSAPVVTISAPPPGGVQATATAYIYTNGSKAGQLRSITVTNGGSGYMTPPTITIAAPIFGTQATATLFTVPAAKRIHVINKAIQELFDPVYGRMNATLAVELPFSSATVATTIPLAYVDAPIDSMDGIKEGETQIWKITHNGVDSHPVHFHLVNVQVINRVDWAGVVKPPEANEVGWKETLRMNPLEDVYVAVRAEKPVTPFGVPRSQRVLDPSQAVGAQMGFTQIDQMTGQAPTYQPMLVNGVTKNVATTAYSNQLTDFDNEYVWHCHILGHEENDFMRPFIFHPSVTVPDAPGKVTVSGNTVTWADPTPYGGVDAQGIPTAGLDATGTPVSSPKNEIGFRIAVKGVVIASVPANTTTFVDTTGAVAAAPSKVTVLAYNAAGTSVAGGSTTAVSGSSTPVTGGTAAAAATAANAATAASAAVSATAISTAASAAATATAAATDAALAAAAPAAPSVINVLPSSVPGSVTLQWANNAALNVDSANGFTNVTGYTLSWGGLLSASGSSARTWTLNAAANGLPNGATITGLTSGSSYTFSLVANNALNAATTGVLSSATPVGVTVTAP